MLCLSEGEQRRAPWRIRLAQQDGPPPPPLADVGPVPLRGGRVAQAGPLRELGGGSGGTEHERVGWLPLGEGEGAPTLTFRLRDQVEWPAAPRQALLWAVLSTAEVPGSPRGE